jgi:hypothetical protein
MRPHAVVYLAGALALVALVAPVVADISLPATFEGSKLSNPEGTPFADLGNFHGAIPQVKGAGWHYWGAREPIVTSDWVVFPAKGEYKFIIMSKSDQFDEADTKADIWAEFEVRLYTEKGLKKLAKTVADLNLVKGDPEKEIILFKDMARADTKKGEPWKKTETMVAMSDKTKGQIAIWFTNDKWQPDPPPAKDRNLHILSMGIEPPASLAVEARGKLATRWAALK